MKYVTCFGVSIEKTAFIEKENTLIKNTQNTQFHSYGWVYRIRQKIKRQKIKRQKRKRRKSKRRKGVMQKNQKEITKIVYAFQKYFKLIFKLRNLWMLFVRKQPSLTLIMVFLRFDFLRFRFCLLKLCVLGIWVFLIKVFSSSVNAIFITYTKNQ